MSRRRPDRHSRRPKRAGAGGDRAGPEAINQGARDWRDYDRHAGDESDHEARDAQAEPTTVVQVDDLEPQLADRPARLIRFTHRRQVSRTAQEKYAIATNAPKSMKGPWAMESLRVNLPDTTIAIANRPENTNPAAAP